MSRGRILSVAGVLVAVLALPATAAGAGATRQIYADFASHGKLVGHYSKAELEAALHDALVQGYGASSRAGLKPSLARQLQTTGLAGVAVAVVPPTRAGGSLPFTGVDLGLIAAGGCVLLALGGALRALGTRD
jgi:hypothetical protein